MDTQLLILCPNMPLKLTVVLSHELSFNENENAFTRRPVIRETRESLIQFEMSEY